MKIDSKWESTEANPDEEYLKSQFETCVKVDERIAAEEDESSRVNKEEYTPLVKAAGLSEDDILAKNKEAKIKSRNALQRVQSDIGIPSEDVEALHAQDLEVTKRVAANLSRGGNPYWQGYIWGASYGGWWSNWNGEGEEVPYTVINPGSRRIDSRAQAWGEGWFDSDYSRAHGYLAFRLNPPSWGHLHVRTYSWLHGYYSIYSDDKWYNSAYARAEVDTWVDVHQHFWRSRSYLRRLTKSGDEIHPTQWGRMDGLYRHDYYTSVAAGDTVTIRVGLHLYCRGKSDYSHSILNFESGGGNYVYVPYVYWYLHL